MKDIARAIDVHKSTISREIKNRRISNDSLIICDKTQRYPFICYNCAKKVHCNKKNVIDMMNNINNVQRKSLDYQTPYELFTQKYGVDISNKFHLKQIPKDEINLSYKLLSK